MIDLYRSLTPDQLIEHLLPLCQNNPGELIDFVKNEWAIYCRDQQLPPLDPDNLYDKILYLAGRGFGKTRSGAEIIKRAALSGNYEYCNIIAPTNGDLIKIVIGGKSGIMGICRDHERPVWNKKDNILKWPNGAITLGFTAEAPERLRGPQSSCVWLDELAAYPNAQEVWDQMLFGYRLPPKAPSKPFIVITTTPRPKPLIRELANDPKTYVIRGSSFDNAKNLSAGFIEKMQSTYANTTIGRQEVFGEILEDSIGKLWKYDSFDRLDRVPDRADLGNIVIALDPAVSDGENSDEFGIVVCARNGDIGFILEDLSGHYDQHSWAQTAVSLYHRYQASGIVAETNQGGFLIEGMIRMIDPTVPVVSVRATQGKFVRAAPISALYQQGKIKHCPGLSVLENQMVTSEYRQGESSPDRVDAMVWGLTHLFSGTIPQFNI
jgi:phage terminase large subunit-like protein